MDDVRKIVLFRALQLGDMLCSIPAIRAIKKTYPEAEITLVGLPWAKGLLERFSHYISSVVVFPGYPALPEQSVEKNAFPEFLQKIQDERYDLAIQMHGSGLITNPLVDLFNARRIAGFYMKPNYCPDSLFVEYPSKLHEIERHLQIAKKLGAQELSTEMEFPITESDTLELDRLNLPVETQKFVIIHPGARGADRQWEPGNFAAIGDFCHELGFEVVITGTSDESNIVNKVHENMHQPAIKLAGKTSLGAMAVLIKRSAGLISNCTGVSHIAAALKTKSVVISLDGEPLRWGPLNKRIHHTIDCSQNNDIELVRSKVKLMLDLIV